MPLSFMTGLNVDAELAAPPLDVCSLDFVSAFSRRVGRLSGLKSAPWEVAGKCGESLPL